MCSLWVENPSPTIYIVKKRKNIKTNNKKNSKTCQQIALSVKMSIGSADAVLLIFVLKAFPKDVCINI